MPCEFPEHHGSSGGGGAWTALLAVLVAIVAAAAITPVVTALTVLIHVLAVAVPVALAAFVALAVWRVRRGRPVLPGIGRRHARALPAARQHEPELEQQPGGVHLHLHGISAEEVAAILRRQSGRPLP